PPAILSSALRHALGLAADAPALPRAAGKSSDRSVLVASADPEVSGALRRAGFSVRPVAFTPFDAEAASKITHFETYNRTAASQRVADIVSAVRQAPSAPLVADGDAALAALLAEAVVPIRRAVLDVDGFDDTSDDAFLERLYIPGLRRAGDVQTAAALAGPGVIVHNSGGRFMLTGVRVEARRLTAREIVDALKASAPLLRPR
ncbi:MAG TPA: hypothetical protein VEL79_17555, partial [Vicinamibacterales bacterium]|nr:hypothetical protein [Vicinamibacterales bacterium]